MNGCLFFGCWNGPGHFLHAPHGRYPREDEAAEHYSGGIHIDGTLAPRLSRKGETVWQGMGATEDERQRIRSESSEYPRGAFLRHDLDSGFTAIQWWDRAQGDDRGACNSTILLRGRHTSAEMLAALRERFPHVVANLARAGIVLVEVTP